MIYFKDGNKYFIDGTDIEVKGLQRVRRQIGTILDNGDKHYEMKDIVEKDNSKKPQFYKIWLMELNENEFKTIAEVKRFLKSEMVLIQLLRAVEDNDKDKLGLLKQLKEQKKEFIIVKTKLDEWDNIDKLSYKQQLKITKWIRKNKGK